MVNNFILASVSATVLLDHVPCYTELARIGIIDKYAARHIYAA
jgi:hypothetical protein